MTHDELNQKVESAVASAVEKTMETVSEAQKEEMNKAIEAAITSVTKEHLEPMTKTIELIRAEEDKKKDDGTYGFKSLGDFANAVIKVRDDSDSRERLEKAAGDGLVVSTGKDGGYAVPEAWSPAMMEKAMTDDESFMGRCSNLPIQANSVSLPVVDDSDRSGATVYGGITWYNTAELEQMTETKPKLYEISFRLNKMTGLAFLSSEIRQDSPVTIEAMLRNGFQKGFVMKTNNAIINGTGAKEPRGIMNDAAIIQVNKETGQTAATIVYENILKMRARSTNYRNSVWLAIPDALVQLGQMSLAVGTGGAPVYTPATQSGNFDMLMGRPVIYTDYCQALGTAGDLLLVDFSDYFVATKSGAGAGIQFATSIHLKFDYDQDALRFTYRWDGQGWRNAAFTPLRGSSRSPFIKLQTRS